MRAGAMHLRRAVLLGALFVLTSLVVNNFAIKSHRAIAPPDLGALNDRVPQTASNRIWRNDLISLEPSLYASQPGSIAKVIDGLDGDLYALDFNAQKILNISRSGKLERAVNGPERGSRVTPVPTDIAVDPTGKLWVVDLTSNSISIFSSNGEFRRSVTTPRPAYRISLADAKVLIMHPPGSGALFSLLDSRNFSFSSLPILSFSQGDGRAIAFDGSIAAGPDGGFIYAPLRIGAFVGIKPGGDLKFARDTIDAEEVPAIQVDADNSMFIARDAPVAAKSVSVISDKVWIFKSARVHLKLANVFDVYDYNTGDYRFSVKLHGLMSNAFALRSGVVVLSKEKIVSFRWLPTSTGQNS